MTNTNDRREQFEPDTDEHTGPIDPGEYDLMLELERLESLEEEMMEMGVLSLEDLRERIAELHSQLDEQYE